MAHLTLLPVVALALSSVTAFTIESAVFLGNVTPSPNDNSIRDLGWTGRIGSTIIDVFGDSFQCDDSYYQINCGPLYHDLYTNAAGIELSPTTFQDSPDSSTPGYFCDYFSDEDATTNGLGVTNPVPLSDTSGVVYTFSFRRNLAGSNPTVGAGVGTVSVTNGVPSCTRLSHYWWDAATEPYYGVNSAWLDSQGSYIYAMGPANTTSAGGDWQYMTRVPVQEATTLSSYEYWNGNSWQTNSITAGEQYALVDTSNNPITGVGQGQGMYNEYLEQYIYCDRYGLDYDVRCRTSANPQGPWTDPVDVFSSEIGGCNMLPNYNGETYGAAFHPWYDSTQKSFVMWFTCGPNIVQAVNVLARDVFYRAKILRALAEQLE